MTRTSFDGIAVRVEQAQTSERRVLALDAYLALDSSEPAIRRVRDEQQKRADLDRSTAISVMRSFLDQIAGPAKMAHPDLRDGTVYQITVEVHANESVRPLDLGAIREGIARTISEDYSEDGQLHGWDETSAVVHRIIVDGRLWSADNGGTLTGGAAS